MLSQTEHNQIITQVSDVGNTQITLEFSVFYS